MLVTNLKAYLANIGMTAKDLADLLEYDTNYIRSIARGARAPGKKLAKILNELVDNEIHLKPKDPLRPEKDGRRNRWIEKAREEIKNKLSTDK